MTRPIFPVRLLALDLDGTILGPDRVISPRVRHAIEEAQRAGVIVTIATGRMYRSAVPFAWALGLTAPIVCYQGAYVREVAPAGGGIGAGTIVGTSASASTAGLGDAGDAGRGGPAAAGVAAREGLAAAGANDDAGGCLLYHRTMSGAAARDAIRWSRDRGFDPHVNIHDRLVMEAGATSAEDYERLAGIGAQFVPDLLAAVRGPVTKVLAVGPAPLPERSLADARLDFAGRAQVTVSHPEYLEWNAPGVTKGRAVRWLARHLGIAPGQVMAVGDQYNDAEMLAEVGHGVAMGGAPEAVRAAARHVTAPFESDGAALAIEALVLGREAA